MTTGERQRGVEIIDLSELRTNGTTINIVRVLKGGDIEGRFEKTKYFVTPPITDGETREIKRQEQARSIPSRVGKLLKLGLVSSGDTTAFTREGKVSDEDTETGIDLAATLIQLRGHTIAQVTTELPGQMGDEKLVLAK